MLLQLLMPFGNRTTPARRRASRGLSTRTFSVGRSPRRISHSAAGDEGMDFIAWAAIGVVLIGVAPLIAMLILSMFYPDLLNFSITPK
jgi:hypothetical protein